MFRILETLETRASINKQKPLFPRALAVPDHRKITFIIYLVKINPIVTVISELAPETFLLCSILFVSH